MWMSVVNLPKTRASRDTVPVIPALAEILDEYRRSMGNPEVGVIFHSGSRLPINVNNLARRVIRPALRAVDLRWCGWHAFRRGLASNLYEMGAPDKVVQRVAPEAALGGTVFHQRSRPNANFENPVHSRVSAFDRLQFARRDPWGLSKLPSDGMFTRVIC